MVDLSSITISSPTAEKITMNGNESRMVSSLDLLKDRLDQVEWLLTGSDHAHHTVQDSIDMTRSVTTQLADLESRLSKLSSRSPVVRDLLRLSECSAYDTIVANGIRRCHLSRPLST